MKTLSFLQLLPVLAYKEVIGGHHAKKGELRYFAHLYTITEALHTAPESSEKIILTAAHCVEKYKDHPDILPIYAGSVTLSSGQKAYEAKVNIHPKYNAHAIKNNITVLTFGEALPLDNNIQAVELLATDEIFPPGGTQYVLGGFSRTSYRGPIASDLLDVNLKVVDQENYVSRYKGIKLVQESSGCAIASGKGACSGDSGSPLVDIATKKLIGITSWVKSRCKTNYPNTFVSTSAHRDYIQSIVGTIC